METTFVDVIRIVVERGLLTSTRSIFFTLFPFQRNTLRRFISSITGRRIVNQFQIDKVTGHLRNVIYALYRVNCYVRWDSIRIGCGRLLRYLLCFLIYYGCETFYTRIRVLSQISSNVYEVKVARLVVDILLLRSYYVHFTMMLRVRYDIATGVFTIVLRLCYDNATRTLR